MNVERRLSTRHARKPRVAAYARVSTILLAQDESLEAQTQYYENKIRSNPEWEYAGIYADRESGTKSANRPEFQRLLRDALDGHIDVILCKNVSRWGRNTVDSLSTIRLLVGNQVRMIFESEDIDTARPGEMFKLNMYAAIAQSESESISENLKWVYRERAKQGVYVPPRGKFFGYDTSEHKFKPDGNAEYVKLIFKMYASGKSASDILKRLHGVKNNKGKPFTVNGIMSILHNEIYVGDKQFGKRKSRNVITGEVDEIQAEGYVRDHHKGLVDRKTWERVQERLGKKHSSPSDQKGMEEPANGGGAEEKMGGCGEQGSVE